MLQLLKINTLNFYSSFKCTEYQTNNTEKSHILLLLLTFYISVAHLLQLIKQYQYIIIN